MKLMLIKMVKKLFVFYVKSTTTLVLDDTTLFMRLERNETLMKLGSTSSFC